MKRVLMSFAAAGALGALGAGLAAAQTLGGFPIHEPGEGPLAGREPAGFKSEVVVSQSPDSRVRTVAQALKLVKAGGTIIVQGGVYPENLDIKKAVAIRGVPDAYGRNVVFTPAPGDNCATVHPDAPMAPVSVSDVVFKFASMRGVGSCIDVAGGAFSLRDSYVVPADAEIPIRAAYGRVAGMPAIDDALIEGAASGKGKDDKPAPNEAARHAGADLSLWAQVGGGADAAVAKEMHVRADQGGPLNGPYAAIRVAAGDVKIEGNVIIGAQTGIVFASADEAMMRGSLTNNVILGNLVGVDIKGIAADLLLNRNTIRYNPKAGLRADVYDGLKLVGNEISANGEGISLSQNVRLATITSNRIIDNAADAIKASSGFYGAVSANYIAGNQGCTIQFFSAQDKILNNVDRKVTAYEDFRPALNYEPTNYAEGNRGDKTLKNKYRRRFHLEKADASRLAPCGDPL
ncbi:MAG TPA: right-handed parallel beta-helix repeat-containing protein [Parvularculaceae bacterium]|nr:right-handed parallel beta-helix repeat-containing protein [Parvularculaceae bacterium]